MPRIPRRWAGAGQAPPPEEQHAAGPTPAGPQQAPQDAQPGSGDAVAATAPAPAEGTTADRTAVLEPVGAGTHATGAPATAGGDAAVDAAPIDGAATALPADAPAAPPAEGDAGAASIGEPFDARPRFRRRTQMRRRLRYLRRLRELAFRDLGGLVFDLHRFGRERADLVAGKLDALAVIDGELRTLERALGDVQEVTELREPGIAACPHCQTLHDTSARFCPGCGTALQGRAAKQAGEPAAGTQEPTGGTQEGAAEPPAAAPAESAPSEQQPTATSS